VPRSIAEPFDGSLPFAICLRLAATLTSRENLRARYCCDKRSGDAGEVVGHDEGRGWVETLSAL
jgi:hypothetical protein